MIVVPKKIFALVISLIILISGSGFTTIKMICLCSGDTTYSIIQDDNCSETSNNNTNSVLDHKCCEYKVLNLKLDKTTFENHFVKSFDYVSLIFTASFLFNYDGIFSRIISAHQQDTSPPLLALKAPIYNLLQNFRL